MHEEIRRLQCSKVKTDINRKLLVCKTTAKENGLSKHWNIQNTSKDVTAWVGTYEKLMVIFIKTNTTSYFGPPRNSWSFKELSTRQVQKVPQSHGNQSEGG